MGFVHKEEKRPTFRAISLWTALFILISNAVLSVIPFIVFYL